MTRSARMSLVALGIVLAAGCGTIDTGNDRVNAEAPLWLHRASGAMHVVFTRALTADSRTVGEPYERGRPEIDPYNGRVFVGSSDHGLYALRASDGSTIWRFETLGAVQSEPLYDEALDIIYFGSNDGALYAVHASDGRLAWRYESGAEVARRPVRSGESLFFANAADNLFAVDCRSGKALWHVHRTPALGMEISGYAGPAFDRGVIFFAFSDGHVGAYNATDGTEKWAPVDLSAEAEQAQGGEALRYLDVDTTPIPDDLGTQGRVVFVASYAGGVFALDEDRGATVWKDDKAIGVTESHAVARARPHADPGQRRLRRRRRRASRAGARDPARVERRERPLGARAGHRTDAVAHPGPRGRRHGAGAAGRCAPRRHDQLRSVLALAPRRQTHRRLRPGLRLLASAGDVRQPGLRGQQRGDPRRCTGRAPDDAASRALVSLVSKNRAARPLLWVQGR